MNFIELDRICSLITRGYKYSEHSLADMTQTNTGYPVQVVSFSDIGEDGIIKENNNEENKLILKNRSFFSKFIPQKYDILLPSTAKTFAKSKLLISSDTHCSSIPVYKSNIILIRAYPEEYDPKTLQYVLNNEYIQQRLIDKVYSEGRVKGLSVEKLRRFEIPIFTEELKKDMQNYLYHEIEKQKIANKLNNLIINS